MECEIRVEAVHSDAGHSFSKQPRSSIRLLQGLGVEGDAHAGSTVQHLSRVRQDPTQPNLRQIHLIAAELLDELNGLGYDVSPGQLGENVTTTGVDLLLLPVGAVLRLGDRAEVELTGLRNPCRQIDGFRPGLLKEVMGRAPDGSLVRRAGVMGIVRVAGDVQPGDPISVTRPEGRQLPLDRV